MRRKLAGCKAKLPEQEPWEDGYFEFEEKPKEADTKKEMKDMKKEVNKQAL
jgi:hypothetical protein